MEEYYSCDQCLWLLQKILQPKCRVCVVRIDPNTSTILKIEEKDTADTLVDSTAVQGCFGPTTEESNNNKDMNYQFEVMMNIIRGIKTIDRLRYRFKAVCHTVIFEYGIYTITKV